MPTKFRLTTTAIAGLMFSLSETGQPADSALRSLLGTDSNTIRFDLDRSRPAAVPLDFRSRVLDSLPGKGQILTLKETQQRKLDALEPILKTHHRESVYTIRVYEAPQAFVGLHQGAVLLLSDKALKLLSSEELQALVAHEIGHEYVWGEFQSAEQRKDHPRLQELELFCDGIAVLTLRRLGFDPVHLLTGLEKLNGVNERVGATDNNGSYPSPKERKLFVETIARLASANQK